MNDEILRFIYVNAMRDATLERAFVGKKRWLVSNELFNKVKTEIETFIDDILNGSYTNQNDYDRDFLKLAKTISKTIDKKSNGIHFTFGNAQKLINIIVKYFYILTYNNFNNTNIRNNFKYCHCPMDGIMLEKVWNRRAQIGTWFRQYKRNTFLVSWSREDFLNRGNGLPERYSDYQKAVRELASNTNNYPIEYDYLNW